MKASTVVCVCALMSSFICTRPQASSDLDGDFDVRQRSSNGCIPPLLAMARLITYNAEREIALKEQEVPNDPNAAMFTRSLTPGILDPKETIPKSDSLNAILVQREESKEVPTYQATRLCAQASCLMSVGLVVEKGG